MLALLLLTTFAADTPETAASWIWYPENPAVEGADQTRYFRLRFRLDAPAREAVVRVRCDDGLRFWVNGQPAPAPLENGPAGAVYDLAQRLRVGENVLACAVYNAGGPGGLIVKGHVIPAAGEPLVIVTDAGWRVAREEPEGWLAPEFDDSGWAPARIVASAFGAPWYGHPAFDMAPFISDEEQATYHVWLESRTAVPAELATEPLTTATLRPEAGHAVLRYGDVAHPALLYRGTVDPLSDHGRRQLALFRDAGVHVYCAYHELSACWPAPDERDYSGLDTLVRAYLSVDPEARLFLILRLVPPNWWMDAHPDELVRYAAGDDYNSADECGRVRRPSLASVCWRDDMLAIWRGAIAHLEAQPWGKRVIGYQPGYGIYTEWHYYGSWTNQMPDTSPAMTRWFRTWLRAHYGSDDRLRAAWRDPQVSIESATVPGVEPRLAAGALGLRDATGGRWVSDYYRCQQELTADALEAFCAAAKEVTRGRVVTGAFYGYYQGVHVQTQGGHLELPRLLDSPAIDYFAAPYDYSHRLMGDDGRTRAVVDAFRTAGKVHMIEADTRTHLHPINEHGRVPDEPSSIAAIRREVASALIHGTALWWCDFGADGTAGWYDHPALIEEVRRLYALAERRLQQPVTSVAQVALIADPQSCYVLGDGDAMRVHTALVDQVVGAMARTGAPFDYLLLSQLGAADLSRYRVLVFLDTLNLDRAARSLVRRATRGRAVIWLWAPGLLEDLRLSPALVTDLTGFPVRLAPGDAGEALVEGDDPLTAGLPVRRTAAIVVRDRLPIAAAGEREQWYNPRDPETMREGYTAFEVAPIAGGIAWRVATTHGWSDVHLRCDVPGCDGVGLTFAGEGAAAGAMLQVVVKGHDGEEWASGEFRVRDEPTTIELPLAGLTRAPWYRGEHDSLGLPLTGLKVVLRGLDRGREGTLRLTGVAALIGETREREQRVYPGAGLVHPTLAIDERPGVKVLARRADGGAVVAVRGEAGQRQVLSTLAALPAPLLTALFEESGVHRYVRDSAVLVQADSALLALHSATGGPCDVTLPAVERLLDALTGEVLGDGDHLRLDLPRHSTTLLERRPQVTE